MPQRIDLDSLPPEVAALLTGSVPGAEVQLVRGGQPVGSLTFRPHVAEPEVVGHAPAAPAPGSGAGAPEGPKVVATGMWLTDATRARLAQELGEGFVVVDLREAPSTADVLLVNPVSPNLIGLLKMQFPNARVIVTEMDDPELGVHYPGPVSRMLEAGASTYLPPRPIPHVAAGVLGHLEQVAAGELGPGAGAVRAEALEG